MVEFMLQQQAIPPLITNIVRMLVGRRWRDMSRVLDML